MCLLALAGGAFPACASKADAIRTAFANYSGKHAIHVSKKNFSLEVYDRNLKAIARYTIAFGSNPDRRAKLFEGDNRTPEGLYFVNEILSMDADKKTGAYGKLKNMNKMYFSAREGHSKFGRPGVDLGDNAYGPRFYGLNYPNDKDKARYRTSLSNGTIPPAKGKMPGIGYGIAIHGNNDEEGVGQLSSSGCIRMYNRDVIEIEQYIQMGTPVIISPD